MASIMSALSSLHARIQRDAMPGAAHWLQQPSLRLVVILVLLVMGLLAQDAMAHTAFGLAAACWIVPMVGVVYLVFSTLRLCWAELVAYWMRRHCTAGALRSLDAAIGIPLLREFAHARARDAIP